LVTWIFICIIHLRFRKAYEFQGHSVNDLPYRAPFFPYGQYIGILMGVLVLVGEGYATIFGSDEIDWVQVAGVYIGVPFYLVLYLAYKIYKKTKIVPLAQCDFVTGVVHYEPSIYEDDDNNIQLQDTSQVKWKKRFKKVAHFLA
jgi:lysine-specific permease